MKVLGLGWEPFEYNLATQTRDLGLPKQPLSQCSDPKPKGHIQHDHSRTRPRQVQYHVLPLQLQNPKTRVHQRCHGKKLNTEAPACQTGASYYFCKTDSGRFVMSYKTTPVCATV